MRNDEIKNAINKLVSLGVLALCSGKEFGENKVLDGSGYIVKNSGEASEEVYEATRELLGDRLSFFSPVPYEYQEWGKVILDAIYDLSDEPKLIYGDAKEQVINKAKNYKRGRIHPSCGFGPYHVSLDDTIDQIIGAYNSRVLLLNSLPETLDAVLSSDSSTLKVLIDDKYEDVLINRSYISAVLDSYDIVGYEANGKVKIIDKDRLITKSAFIEKEKRLKKYDCLNDVVNYLNARKDDETKVLLNGTTAEIIDFFSSDKLTKDLINLDSGVWEGFSIGQHTETVMRWFDINYKNELPSQVVPFVKLTILLHDIGKGKAAREMRSQKELNEIEANNILTKMGYPDKIKNTVLFLMGPAQNYTTLYYIRKHSPAKQEFMRSCRDFAEKYYDNPDDALQVLWDLASVLQNCDSGSYTLKGITRNSDGSYYFNGNRNWGRSFNDFAGYEDTLKGGKLTEPEK